VNCTGTAVHRTPNPRRRSAGTEVIIRAAVLIVIVSDHIIWAATGLVVAVADIVPCTPVVACEEAAGTSALAEAVEDLAIIFTIRCV